MKRIYIFTFLVFSFFQFSFGLDFPGDSKTVKNFFGQINFNNFNKSATDLDCSVENGIIFENVNTVKSSETAEKILVIEDKQTLTGFPSPVGNAVILLHKNNFQTIYGNLDDISILENTDKFLKGDLLGKTALNKDASTKPLIFKIIDINEKSKNFVNPLLFLSEIQDKKQPEIHRVFLESKTGKIINLTSKTSVPAGNYKLFIECHDKINNSARHFPPFEIAASLNGNLVSNIFMQTMQVKNGKVYIHEKITLNMLYQRPNAFFICDLQLPYGNSNLKLIVRDYNKNSTKVSFELSMF